MLLMKKCQLFGLFRFGQNKTKIMLGDFAEKNETLLTIKNRIIQTQKNRIFPKA